MIRILGLLIVVLLAGLIAWDFVRPARYRRLAADIRVGDDKARVESIMGWPTETATSSGGLAGLLFGIPSEVWIYGRAVEWQSPIKTEYPYIASPASLDFRFFEPHDGDVAVYFSSAGKVTRVESRP